MTDTIKNYQKIALELKKLEELKKQLREKKSQLVNSKDYKAVKRQEDLRKKKFWNKAHNTSAKLFRDMTPETVNKIKNIVSDTEKNQIDIILENLKKYQGQ